MVFDVRDWGLLLLAVFLLSYLRISYEWKRNSVKTFHKALIPKILILGAFLIIIGCVLFFLFPVFGIMLSVSSIAIMLLTIFFCFAFLEFGITCLHDRWEFFRLHKALIGAGITTAVALACFSSFMAKSTWLHNSFKTEGVIFSVVVGLFTVIGFFIAIKHLHDVHTRIGTYDEYLDRSARLIEKTHYDANKEFEKYAKDKSKWPVVRQSKYTIRMVCFTPKHGNMTSRNAQAFLDYDHVLHHTINERRVRFEIVCLDYETGIEPLRGLLKDYYDKNDNFNDFPIKEEFFPATTAPCELERFYNGFSDRFGRRHCFRGLTEAYMAMYLLERKETQKISHKIIPRLRNELPTFHFILTRKRAIVVSPLLLPKSLESPLLRSRMAETQETGLRKHIDMIGFETTEPHILADLNRAFDFWAGSEKTIRLKTENEAEALTLSYMVPQNNNGMQKELSNIGLLFLHGLTTAPDSTFSYHIRTLREAAYIEGVSSFEVGYRGRGLDKQNALNFTIDTAISDVVRIIEYLTAGNDDNQIPNLSRIMIVARGLGAYFALAVVVLT